MDRARRGGHAGRVAGRRAEERRAADVDHLDRLVDADQLRPDLRRERLDVDDDEVDQADAVLDELRQLRGDVAPGEDPGVDRRVERLDLAADQGRDAGQLGDRPDLDAVGGEVLAGAVGGEDLDAEAEEVAGEPGDPFAVGHRQQGSHPGSPPIRALGDASSPRRCGPPAVYAPGMAYSGPSSRPPSAVARRRTDLPRQKDRPCTFRPGTTCSCRSTRTRSRTCSTRRGWCRWSCSSSVVLYNVRTRALHRHAPYLDLWEWMLWTGLALFGLLLTARCSGSSSSCCS